MAGFDPSNNMEVSTSSIAIFGAESTMLRIGFRGESMFLTIIPRVPDPNGGKARWPKELGHTAALKGHMALALYNGFMDKVLPDIRDEKDHVGHCVIPLNRDSSNLCGFAWVGGKASFTIFTGVGSDRTCSDQASFIFEPTQMIDGYNPNTGAYNIYEVQGQLFLIVEALRMFGTTVNGSVGHNVHNAVSWNMDMMISNLRAIANKLGATPGQYGRYRGYDSSWNGGGGSSPFTSDGYTSETSTVTGVGNSGNVSWSTGYNEQASVGRAPVVTDVQEVSSLDGLIGSDNGSPF